MKEDNKLERVKAACKEFIKEHLYDLDKEYSKCEIEKAIQEKLNFELNYKVSDFAKGNCKKLYSKNTVEYFTRTKRGFYKIKV